MNSPRSILPLPARTTVKPVPVALSTQALRTINAMRGPGASEARRAVYFELQNALHAERTRMGCTDRQVN